MASAAPPTTTSLSQALGHWEPFCPAAELRPFFLSPLARVCKQLCWSTEGKAQGLPALPRSCQQPCGDYCHSIHPFQQESCQEWVAGMRTASAKDSVPNKGCWYLSPTGVTMLMPSLPFSAAKGQEKPLQTHGQRANRLEVPGPVKQS